MGGDRTTIAYKQLVSTYAYRMRLAKVSVIGMVVIVLSFLAWPAINGLLHQVLSSDSRAHDVRLAVQNSMAVNSSFFGLDDKGLPYVIKADLVQKVDEDLLWLEQVTGSHQTQDGKQIAWSSKNATMAQKQKTIKLQNDVKLLYDNAYDLIAAQVMIDYGNSESQGSGGVELRSQLGKIMAESFEITQHYGKMRFYGGRVKTVLNSTTTQSIIKEKQ